MAPKLTTKLSLNFRNPLAWHFWAPGPFGPGTPKESEKSPKWCPGAPGSPKECASESEKSPKTQLRTLFRLFSDSGAHSLGTLGLPGAGGPGTPFRTLFGLRHGGGALKQPIKQPTETPTSTLALMGRFPSLMGRFPTFLNGAFHRFRPKGPFYLLKIHWENSPFLRKGALRGSRWMAPKLTTKLGLNSEMFR